MLLCSTLLLLDMTATAFYRCVLALVINLLVTFLAHFMSGFLEAVDLRIAYILVMTGLTLVNHHDFILGVMTIGAGINFLVLTMGEISRFAGRLRLQDDLLGTYTDFNSDSAADNT